MTKYKLLIQSIPAFFVLLFLSGPISSADPIRVGVLKYGTVSWELDVVKRNKLDETEGIDIEVVPFASTLATLVALQSKEVDMVVSDWIWVSRQRSVGKPFTFIPYSSALGAVMVPDKSTIMNLNDLRGKNLGVAGGALDKSWLMLKLYTEQRYGLDLETEATPNYASPPLLNGQIQNNQLDSVLNYWHYCTRLETKGYRRLISMQTIVSTLLGFNTQLPMLGYVFDENWANENESKVLAFAAATIKARELMETDDKEWNQLRTKMRVEDDNTFNALRKRYREGIPQLWSKQERAAASIIMRILAEEGGTKLVGNSKQLAPGTFWNKLEF